MPQTADLAEIRQILETDRVWAAYALADLEPDQIEHCTWFRTAGDPPAIVLLYRAFATPVLITIGSAEVLQAVFDEVDAVLGDVREIYLVARPDVYTAMKSRFEINDSQRMRRMVLDPGRPTPNPDPRAVSLNSSHLDALHRLHADGEAAGESPDFFTPAMLERGVYFGVWEGDELTAAAGTHVLAPTVGVGAIGNVYTRRDRRRQGLGAAVTNAVASALRERNLSTIILNVWSRNLAAADLYERLGFRHVFDFYEAVVNRTP